MCPITLPDPEAEWKAAVEKCAEIYGMGNFCALDVAEWIEANPWT